MLLIKALLVRPGRGIWRAPTPTILSNLKSARNWPGRPSLMLASFPLLGLPILEYNVPWFIVLLWFNFRSPILCHVIEGNNLLSNFSTAINKLQLRKQVAPYSEAALLCQNHLHIWCRAVILSLHYSVLCTATLSAISLRCINNHYMETNVCFKALPLLVCLAGCGLYKFIVREK